MTSEAAQGARAPQVSGVRAAVARVRRVWVAFRVAECALTALAVAGLGAAVGILSGASGPTPSLGLLLAGCGALAALTMARERARNGTGFARSLDGRLNLGGALCAALEAGARAPTSPLVRLLCARVQARLTQAGRVRLGEPPSLAFVAAAFLGLACATFALEFQPRRPSRSAGFGSAAHVAAGIVQQIEGLERQTASERAETLDRLERALPYGAPGAADPSLDAPSRAGWQRALNALEGFARAETRPLPGRTGTQEGLDRIGATERARAEALAARLRDRMASAQREEVAAARAPARDVDPSQADPGQEAGQGGGTSRADGAPEFGADRTHGEAHREGQGTGGREPATTARPAELRDPDGSAGPLGGRWWPREHDPVVRDFATWLAERSFGDSAGQGGKH